MRFSEKSVIFIMSHDIKKYSPESHVRHILGRYQITTLPEILVVNSSPYDVIVTSQ